jgi:hypothetical protein
MRVVIVLNYIVLTNLLIGFTPYQLAPSVGIEAQESKIPPKRITSKTTRAATGEDDGNTREVAVTAKALGQGAAGPSTRAPERSLNTNHRSRGAVAESEAPRQTAGAAFTTNDLQQIIRDELLKILHPQGQINR